MKIAVPVVNNKFSAHFGHAREFAIFETNQSGAITGQKTLNTDDGCTCKSDIAGLLRENGVDLVVSGHMGKCAHQKLTDHGLQVIRGYTGTVDELPARYYRQELHDQEIFCKHHN